MFFNPDNSFTRSFLATVALLACAIPPTLLAQGSRPDVSDQQLVGDNIADLVLAGAEKPPMPAHAPLPRDVIRSRPAALDFSVLQKLRADIAVGRMPTIRIAFFDDAAMLVQIERIESVGSNGTAFFGSVPGIARSNAVIVEENGVISGNVNVLGNKYQIRNVGAAGHVLRQIDATALPPEHGEPVAPLVARAARAKDTMPPVASLATADDGSLIDVMVIYTPAARISQGSTAAMNSLVNLAIAETNNAYANSLVTQRLRLVYTGEINYTEVDFSTDLARLQGTADGFMDDIHRLRDLYGADLVSLWGNYVGGCGLANLMLNESVGFANQGFNVVDRNCATSNYSFGHELGHNMGLQHDVFDGNSGTTVTPDGSTTSTPINYAHGYVDMNNRFRSIMAISAQCDAQMPAINCLRVPYFSNPNVSYNNSAFFPGAAMSAPTGNANAQESRALNDTRETTANFRASVNLTGPGTIIFIPVDYTVNESAGSVTLSLARHAGSTGVVTVAYTTVGGTATAGSDFTATSGVLTWANGETGTKTITVPVLADGVLEGPEDFSVTIDTPTGGVSIGVPGGNTATATVTLLDGDTDGFPVGCAFPLTGWTNQPSGATAGWAVASDSFYGPNCSLKSNPTLDGGKAQIQFTGNFTAGNISFARRVSSQNANDCLHFLIDGVEKNIIGTCSGGLGAGGEVAWALVSFSVSAGMHTVTWSFEKDTGGAAGADAAWIDSVVLPLAGAPLIQSAAPPGGFLNIPYSHTLIATGSPTITFAASPFPLPPGLSLDTNTGVISGTPSALGSTTFRIKAINGILPFDQKDYSVDIVGAVPGAPVISTATPGNGHASIAFTPPVSQGSTAITGYTASCNPNAFTGTAMTSPIDITGLVNGTEYTCAVTASNQFGASASSSAVLVTPLPTKPSAPTIGTATAGNTQAFIAFTAPATDGGSPITNYTATCDPGALTGTAVLSPIAVGSLVNGSPYTCSVTATNAVGNSTASATVPVTPTATPTLSLLGVVSSKSHAATGTFDIAIDTTQAITGAVSVEPRVIGAGHRIMFKFNNAITSAGSLAVVDGSNANVSASAIASGNDVVVMIPALADNQRVNVTLTGVNGIFNTPPVSLGFLIGDVNNTRSVNSSDISGVKARSGQTTTIGNFRFDVNASGAINSSDISAVKARSGLLLQ